MDTMNILFQKKLQQKWTWARLHGKTRHFIISTRKSIVDDVRVLNKFSECSDHQMVCILVELNLNKERKIKSVEIH